MRKIRVTVGTVGYYDAKHAHKRMTAADGPFECEDTQAEHFVSAGVAEYVGGAIEVDEADEQEVTGHLAKSQLEEMTIQQLQNLAGDLGVDVTGCKKKADYVDAIAAAEVNAGGMVDDEDTDGDGIANVPEYYSTTHYRKQVDDSRNIVDLVKNPNKFTAIIVGAIAVLILLVIFIIVLIKKIVKKVKSRKMKK
jgi:hypothetical protein